jgi:hypothetical protein
MVVFYNRPEFAELSGILVAEAAQSPAINGGIERAMADIPEARNLFPTKFAARIDYGHGGPPGIGDARNSSLIEEINTAYKECAFERVIEIADRILGSLNSESPKEFVAVVAKALVMRGLAEGRLNDPTAALATYDEVIARFSASDDRELQVQVARALVSKGAAYIEMGDAGGALNTSTEIDRAFETLTDSETIPFGWWARWLRTKALLGQAQQTDAMSTFQSLYASLDPGNEAMMHAMQTDVPELIRMGAEPAAILKILSSDKHRSNALEPLVVAVRQEAGETVRAPTEVLEVAADIRERIRAAR